MQIQSVDFYMDGGTAQIITDQGEYYVDRRLYFENCFIYDKYPDQKDAKLMNEKREELISALEIYNHTEPLAVITILIQEMEQAL